MIPYEILLLASTSWGFPVLSSPPPEAYIHLVDQDRAKRRNPEDPPCTQKRHEKGIDFLESLPTDQCYKMLPTQRMRGIWLNEFEGSTFYPGATTSHPRSNGHLIWLDTSRTKLVNNWAKPGRAVLLEFYGRRTRYRGSYGHMGLFDLEIIVDRVISARELK